MYDRFGRDNGSRQIDKDPLSMFVIVSKLL